MLKTVGVSYVFTVLWITYFRSFFHNGESYVQRNPLLRMHTPLHTSARLMAKKSQLSSIVLLVCWCLQLLASRSWVLSVSKLITSRALCRHQRGAWLLASVCLQCGTVAYSIEIVFLFCMSWSFNEVVFSRYYCFRMKPT